MHESSSCLFLSKCMVFLPIASCTHMQSRTSSFAPDTQGSLSVSAEAPSQSMLRTQSLPVETKSSKREELPVVWNYLMLVSLFFLSFIELGDLLKVKFTAGPFCCTVSINTFTSFRLAPRSTSWNGNQHAVLS